MTLRLKGEIEAKGALAAAALSGRAGRDLLGLAAHRPALCLTPDWSEQTVSLAPDPAQWTCLGSRHDRADFYGELPLETILGDVNTDILRWCCTRSTSRL